MVFGKNELLIKMIRGIEQLEGLLQITSVVNCFYKKMAVLCKLESKTALFFKDAPLNMLKVLNHKKDVL